MNNLTKFGFWLFLGVLFLITMLENTSAQDFVEFLPNNIILSGTGCEKQTFDILAFGNEVSTIFNNFQAIAQKKHVMNTFCNLKIPIKIPSGYIIQDITIISSGFADIPQGGSATIETKVIFESSTIGIEKIKFKENYSDNYQLTTKAVASKLNNCSISKTTFINIKTTLTTRGKNQKRPSTINISTQDTSIQGKKLKLKLRANNC